MATITSPADLERRMVAFQRSRLDAAEKTIVRVAEIALEEAARLTRGPVRTGREKSPVSPVLPIGQRSGALRFGWRTVAFTRGNERGIRLYNIVPHHVFVLSPRGTARMRSRGFWEALRRFTTAAFRQASLHGVSVRIPD